MTISCYCDESIDANAERTWTMAGYLGSEEEWLLLSTAWRDALKSHDLAEFHSADCEGGYGQFKQLNRNERNEVQMAFINVVQQHCVRGYAVSVDLRRYKELQPRLKQLRTIPTGSPISGSLDDPYMLGFQALIEAMATNERKIGLPDTARLHFLFDRTTHAGRARHLYGSLRGSRSLPFTRSIATDVSFGSRLEFLPLQAADLLAYEFYRHKDDRRTSRNARSRWQWKEIKKTLYITYHFDRIALNDIISLL